jgi:hypothetical protein
LRELSDGGGAVVEPQVAVGVVLDHRHTGLKRGCSHGGAARLGHGAAGGVLEVRQQVDEARACRALARLGAQVVGEHAAVVAVHADHVRLHRRERLQRAEVGGRFHQDAAAGVDQDLGHQVQALLGAGGDQHLVGVHVHALLLQVMRHPVAQGAIAFAGGVLQGGAAVLRQHPLRGF